MTRLPLFPLGMVLFPGMPLQLQVFEDRYVQLINDLSGLDPTEQEFGVIGIRHGHEVGPDQAKELHTVGCAARLAKVRTMGPRYAIQALGMWRFRLDAVTESDTPYAVAEVTRLPEDPGDPQDVEAAAVEARAAVQSYAAALNGQIPELPSDPDELAYSISALVPLDMARQQTLLEAPTTAARLAKVRDVLREEGWLVKSTRSLPFRRQTNYSPN